MIYVYFCKPPTLCVSRFKRNKRFYNNWSSQLYKTIRVRVFNFVFCNKIRCTCMCASLKWQTLQKKNENVKLLPWKLLLSTTTTKRSCRDSRQFLNIFDYFASNSILFLFLLLFSRSVSFWSHFFSSFWEIDNYNIYNFLFNCQFS